MIASRAAAVLAAMCVAQAAASAAADGPAVALSAAEATETRLGKGSREAWRPYAITLAPIFVLYQDIVGLRPLAPGFAQLQLRPQLGDLPDLEVVAHTPRGPVRFRANREANVHRVEVTLPKECEAELLLPAGVASPFPALAPDAPAGVRRYRVPAGGGRFQMPATNP